MIHTITAVLPHTEALGYAFPKYMKALSVVDSNLEPLKATEKASDHLADKHLITLFLLEQGLSLTWSSSWFHDALNSGCVVHCCSARKVAAQA